MRQIDASFIAALKNHKHLMVDCGEGVRRCLYCTLELRVLEGRRP